MFDIPDSDIVGVRVDEEAVKSNKCPEYISSRQTSPTADEDEMFSNLADIKQKQTHDNKISIPTGWNANILVRSK